MDVLDNAGSIFLIFPASLHQSRLNRDAKAP
jgi:hypothetical protein